MNKTISTKGIFLAWFNFVLFMTSAWLSGYVYCSTMSQEEMQPKSTAMQINVQVDELDKLKQVFEQRYPVEFETIHRAALRNGLSFEQLRLLCAIRFAENGPVGLELGVMSDYAKNTNLDRQAGACAFEIKRHVPEVTEQAILAFADRYCPPSVDKQGNENWKRNTLFWYIKLGGML